MTIIIKWIESFFVQRTGLNDGAIVGIAVAAAVALVLALVVGLLAIYLLCRHFRRTKNNNDP